MNKIIFTYDNPNLIFNKNIANKEDYELLEPCCCFEIVIDDKIFFSEPDFPIFEFWKQLYNWSLIDNDFHYNSLETDDNPLITFSRIDNTEKYSIYSKWQMFDCVCPFTKDDLMRAFIPRCVKNSSNIGDGSVCW